jgi:RNA polymerase sigma factor (TIGR02999 family)
LADRSLPLRHPHELEALLPHEHEVVLSGPPLAEELAGVVVVVGLDRGGLSVPGRAAAGRLGRMPEVTRLLEAAAAGDRRAADDLLPVVYDELRKLAAARLAAEKPGQTLQPTALVHEAYLRLVGPAGARVTGWDSRGHFFAAAAAAMRHILVDRARTRLSRKRGGDRGRADLDLEQLAAPEQSNDVLSVDEALTRLAAKDARKARLVELRYFAGMTTDEAAAVLGISPVTADRDWTFARAWLHRALADSD